MSGIQDGPASTAFSPIAMPGRVIFAELGGSGVSADMAAAAGKAPTGTCICRGIPFRVGKAVVVGDRPVTLGFRPVRARQLCFLHTSDLRPMEHDRAGLVTSPGGPGRLGEHAADYVIVYADGSEETAAIRRRHQVGMFTRRWGENCFEAVADEKPQPLPAHPSETVQNARWGVYQTRASARDSRPYTNWIWCWENPHPSKAIVGVRFMPVCGALVVSAITAGRVSSPPTRWRTRRKAILRLPAGQKLDPRIDDDGAYKQVKLDLGQVISVEPRTVYPNHAWPKSHNNLVPDLSGREVLVEYVSHEDACFHLPGGQRVAVAKVEAGGSVKVQPVEQAAQKVTVRVVDKASGRPVAVKLHVHGQAGEYLAPEDRHRIPNSDWFQDYSVDFSHLGVHHCTYIDGEARMLLPLGKVYVEVSKGFEMRPVRKVVTVSKRTREITVEVEKVLPWRDKGWVTADTHVHFLSPPSALLEGAAEGVNVVNLLASQWGELMTNVGDFDGKTTFGSKEAGGDGEYLVRVGTENRQHVLGHISLLGYGGRLITPMTTGGTDESAIGDPVAVLLTEWARQCKRQGGVVVLPHFPNPRAEHAATVVSGDVDAVEMTSWGDLYSGIDPYSLSDWYRYLNCGYLVAAVGGTDKMSAATAVGTVRTYARIGADEEFTYETWKEAVRRAHTFVTYGPLLELTVEGRTPGSWIDMPAGGGTVDVAWELASVTVPMSRVDLVVSGEIRESRSVRKWRDAGNWSVKVDRSSWLGLLVRGHYQNKPEMIAAHSSPVMVRVANSGFFSAADALTILQQIEGALAYLDTVGTRAETAAYRRMRIVLTSAHRTLHNRMHQAGQFHQHGPATDHPEHH